MAGQKAVTSSTGETPIFNCILEDYMSDSRKNTLSISVAESKANTVKEEIQQKFAYKNLPMEYDMHFRMPPVKKERIKLRIRSIKEASPRFFEP